ncbi:unnamed protein product, partial [Didymodactylos carnosus]
EAMVNSTADSMKNMNINDAKNITLDTSNIVKVLVIGETGSGKSTFINYLTNYFRNGSLNNIKVAIPSKYHPQITESFNYCENNISDITQSKTDTCNQYIFIEEKTYRQYLFLDTPGLSDTRGAEQDNINMNKIIESVENLQGLTAVIIVVNGTTGRLTLNLRNVISKLRGNLPDVVMDNVIVILTNAKRHEANFQLSSLQLHGTVYPYYMQNSAFSQDPNIWDQTAMNALQFDWDQSMDEMKRMIETIDTFKTKSVSAFKDMKEIRNAIKALMHEARLEVSKIQKMQDELAAFEHALKQYKTEEVSYKNYIKERYVETKELVDAKYNSTVCRRCDFVCHDNCGLNETTAHSNQILTRCWAILPQNGCCTQCPQKCFYTEHYHARKKMKISQKKLQDVLYDIKVKYDNASKNKNDFQQKIQSTTDTKKMLEQALKQKNEQLKFKCNELRKICSGFNLAQELYAFIDHLKAESTMLRNVEAKQQAEEFIRSLSEFCRQLELDQTSKQVLPPMKLVDTYKSVPLRSSVSTTSSTPMLSSSASSSSEDAQQVGPNLNSSVLDLIIKLNKSHKSDSDDDEEQEETPRNRRRKSIQRRNKNEDSSESEEESNDEEEEKQQQQQQQHDRHQTGQKKQLLKKQNVEQWNLISTPDLVIRHSDCGKDKRTANLILQELNKRAQGKSSGPLLTPSDVATFTKYTQTYTPLDAPTLSHIYLQLQQKISSITEPDILNIARVPANMLFEIAAIYTLITQKNAMMNYPDQRLANFSSYSNNEQLFRERENSVCDLPQFSPDSNFGRPFIENMNDMTRQQSYPPAIQNRFNYNNSNRQVNNTGFSTHVYPQVQNRPLFSNQTTFEPIHDPKPINVKNVQNTSYQSSPSSQLYPNLTRQEFGPPTIQPPPSSFAMFDQYLSSPSPLGSPYNVLSSRAGSAFAMVTPKTDSPDFTIISVNSATNDFTFSPSSSSSSVLVTDISDESLNNANITKLLTLYNDAGATNKPPLQHAIYGELERRCYGNNPQLIKDHSGFYDMKMNEYELKSQSELETLYSQLKQKIHTKINGDATHINEIPKEWIIEAGALFNTIQKKKKDNGD